MEHSPPSRYTEGELVLPDGTPAGEDDFLRLAASAEYILIGERHDRAGDHKKQAELLEILARQGRKPVLGLEMLPRDRYKRVLADFSSGATSLAAFPEAVDWKKNWGFDFGLYQPVFAVAGQYAVPVYGLNIPNELRKSVSKKGLDGLSAAEKKGLPRSIVPPLPVHREKLTAFFNKHAMMLAEAKKKREVSEASGKERPVGAVRLERVSSTGGQGSGVANQGRRTTGQRRGDAGEESRGTGQGGSVLSLERLERFLLIQSLWDSTMAESAVAARRQEGLSRPVVILAGTGHVEHGYGIASRLALFDPEARGLLVMPFSGSSVEAGVAHLYYYSPDKE